MPSHLTNGDLIFSRETLITAVNERWSSDQKEGRFKRTIVCSWLKQALAQGDKSPLKLNAVPISKLEKDVAKAELELTEPLLDVLRSQRCCLWCRVVDKPDSSELVVWLHDILNPASKQVAKVLAKIPKLSQPPRPPGIPAGIAPQRRPPVRAQPTELKNASNIQTSTKGFAAPVPSVDFISCRSHTGPHETPPVDEARLTLIDGLADVWPEEDHTSVFVKTASKICLWNGFALGKTVPYEIHVVPAANMSTHLHKGGIGMNKDRIMSMLARPDISPFFKVIKNPKNPPDILLLISNVYNGHPSDLITDIVQQTCSVESHKSQPSYYPATIMAPALKNKFRKPAGPNHGSEASHSTPASTAVKPTDATCEEVASTPAQMQQEAALSVADAKFCIQKAVAAGVACAGEGFLAVARRNITWACLTEGFCANGKAAGGGRQLAYKLHNAEISKVGKHARESMEFAGFGDEDMTRLLQGRLFRTYFQLSTYGEIRCVRPSLLKLLPDPDTDTIRILDQIQLVDSPFRSHAEASAHPDMPGSSQHGTGGRNRHANEFAAEDEDGTESMKQIKMVDSFDSAVVAMQQIDMWDCVTVGCGALEGLKTDLVSVIPVLAGEVCYVFDMTVTDSTASEIISGVVKQVMEKPGILKITHDCGHLAAALQKQLSSGLCSVFDTEVAYGFAESLRAMGEGTLHKPKAHITLVKLLEKYGVKVADQATVMRPTEKSWSKRPLPQFLQQYCMLMCGPVKLLADRMTEELGSLGKAKVLSMSRAAAERSLEPADRDPVDLDTRKHDMPFIKAHGTSASANSHPTHNISSSKEDAHPIGDKRDAMDDKAYDKSTWHVSQKCALHVIQEDP